MHLAKCQLTVTQSHKLQMKSLGLVVAFNLYVKKKLRQRTVHCETVTENNYSVEMAASTTADMNVKDIKADASSPEEEEFTKPICKNGRFKNPWDTWVDPKVSRYMYYLMTTRHDITSIPPEKELDQSIPVLKPDVREFSQPLASGVRLMWVGHATVVAQVDGFTVITDPMFSQRASMSQWFGPKRYRNPPCTVEELPKIDAVVISHNHYDHLDHGTVLALNRRFGSQLKWFVPAGLKGWMKGVGCDNVQEMTWWEEQEVEGSNGVRVACTPCQHWCRRGVNDENKVLWSSWCVLGPKHSFHFAGDTGYCKGFKQIGRKYGPFTAAAIPIGAYHPRWFMGPQHVDPQQAVKLHTELKSKHSLGIHWGTFVLTREHYLEPREHLALEMEKQAIRPDAFVTVHHGAIATFGADDTGSKDTLTES